MSRNGCLRTGWSAWVVCLAAIACGVLLGETARAQITDAEFFGRHPSLERKLATRVTVAWEGIPLRAAAERLATTQDLAVWIDRRVDPTQELSLDLAGVSLSDLCDEVARQCSLAWVPYGGIVYFGPPQAASELRTLRALGREELQKLNTDGQQEWRRPRSLSLPRLSEPRKLVEQLTTNLGVKMENPDDIPHDLWRGAKYPDMAPADWLTLLLVGFDRTWQLDSRGGTVRIVPIKRPVLVERVVAAGENAEKAAQLAARQPEVKLRREQGRAYLAARVEQHEQLTSRPAVRTPRSKPREGGRQVYSLTIRDQPLGPLLEQIAKKLELELEIAAELKEDATFATRRVSFTVNEVSLDDLAQAIATAGGVRIEVAERTLRVSP